MEILKLNLKKEKRERAFSLFSSANFAVSIILGFIIGLLLDAYPNSWKFLFFISSLVGLISISIQINIPIIGEISNFTYVKKNTSIIEKITTPWINCFALLKKNPAFYNFQKGFMLGGVGLMLIIPASIIFYADILNIKYSTMSNSKLIFMGIGFVLTTPIWRKLISKISINNLTAYLCLGFGLFPYLLFLSKIYIEFLYIAFLFYGIVQSGSHLLWHLSGTLFSNKEENSIPYSTVNILMVGIRGAIAPLISYVLCKSLGPSQVMLLGSICCFIGFFIMKLYTNIEKSINQSCLN